MKVDYAKYPDIPPGCQLNENKKTGLFQVFRERRVRDPETGKNKVIRETIGSIRDGKYRPGENYLLRQQNQELLRKIEQLESQVRLVPKLNHETAHQSKKVQGRVEIALENSNLDQRKASRIKIPMSSIALAAMMSALGGESDAVLIEDYLKLHQDFFKKYMPDCHVEDISHDTVRRNLMLIDPKRFADFYTDITSNLIKQVQVRVVAADGQAVRATGRKTKDNPLQHGAQMVMSFYDTSNRVSLMQEVIDKKTNEISVGFKMIESLALAGSIVTADAMSCQVRFVDAVLDAQADYVLSLKGNQDASWNEVICLFAKTHESQIKRYQTDLELDHGRIEQRTVDVIPGKLLPMVMLQKWNGLSYGSVVRVRTVVTQKATNQTSDGYLYYITSMPPYEENVERIYEAIRAHWGIENNLHYMLDVYWRQDSISATKPSYIANRTALNKLALAMLEHYKFWLWNTGRVNDLDDLSIRALQARCRKPEVAIECLAAGLGYI